MKGFNIEEMKKRDCQVIIRRDSFERNENIFDDTEGKKGFIPLHSIMQKQIIRLTKLTSFLVMLIKLAPKMMMQATRDAFCVYVYICWLDFKAMITLLRKKGI